MFLKNRNIIFKMKISKVTDYAALSYVICLSNKINHMTIVFTDSRIDTYTQPNRILLLQNKLTASSDIFLTVIGYTPDCQ